MRISWGYKIFFAYTAFVIMILVLVYKANRENFDLVTENYYEAELKYQDVIDQKDRVAQLSERPRVTHSVAKINIQLPQEFTGKEVEGEVFLYRPSDASKDMHRPFKTSDGFYAVDLGTELSGLYEVKLSWLSEGKRFFDERKIIF